MKGKILSSLVVVVLATTSCNRSSYEDGVVNETYVHKYGVSVSKEDWEQRGKDGQVVVTQKDGLMEKRNYRNGQLEGETTYTFPQSQTIQKRELYTQGELKKTTLNYPSGLPMEEKETVAPGCTVTTCWYESGSPLCVERVEAGKIVTGQYFNPQHEQESEVATGDGVRIRRDTFGQLLSKDTVIGGKMTSRTTYHANGSPESVTQYEHDQIAGERKTFQPDGAPNTIEHWVAGEQEGVTAVYRNGEKVAEIPYLHGRKNGVERRFREGSVVEVEISWKEGLRQGPTRSFVGANVVTDWYHDGRQVSKVQYEQLNGTLR